MPLKHLALSGGVSYLLYYQCMLVPLQIVLHFIFLRISVPSSNTSTVCSLCASVLVSV